MIELKNIIKSYRVKDKTRLILRDLNYRFEPNVNVGILGRNGAGKSTLLRIIGGAELPDSGRIIRKSRVSWPIGFAGCFHGKLTGRENLRFTSRIYGADIKQVTDFVDRFAALGPYLDMPVQTYSSGMKAKLAFGLSMAIDFNFYLIDEVTAVGDASFQAKCKEVFDERKARSSLIVVSHSISTIKQHCDKALVLDDGHLISFPSLEKALDYYNKMCKGPQIYHFVKALPKPAPSGGLISNPVNMAG